MRGSGWEGGGVVGWEGGRRRSGERVGGGMWEEVEGDEVEVKG